MSERWAVVLALCTALGAAMPHSLPVWLGATVAFAALACRRPVLLCLGAALLASSLSERSWSGLHPPEPGRQVESRATLITDPVEIDGAVKVELRLLDGHSGGKRVEAWARDRAAGELRPRLAGEEVSLVGRLSPVSGRRQAYLARRHIAARLNVSEVGSWSPGGRLARLANDLRRTLLRGASSLSDDHRALFTGFVLGDDREQGPGTVDDFRASGLTHLLAVSGQNVAFVIALAAPVLRWLGLRGRLLAGLCLLVGFGVLTRWEPSVLRAEAMAAVTMVAATLGRPASTLRVLALATTALLVIDPLLVGSVGFLLSCGACAGIALFAGPLTAKRVPLPLAVTLAAQIGVTPVLLPVFGGLPVASLPANLLAVPAAGPVMVWGLAGGLPAGLVGEPLATLVHLPTRLLVGWIAGVARWSADLPLGQLRAPHVIALVVLAALYALVAIPDRIRVHPAGWIRSGSPKSPRHVHPEPPAAPPGDTNPASPVHPAGWMRPDSPKSPRHVHPEPPAAPPAASPVHPAGWNRSGSPKSPRHVHPEPPAAQAATTRTPAAAGEAAFRDADSPGGAFVPPPPIEPCQKGGRRGGGGGSSSGGAATTATPMSGAPSPRAERATIATRRLRIAIAATAAAVVLWPAGPGAGPATADGRPVGGGARLWSGAGTGGATVLVVTKARPGPLLTDLRNSRIRGLSLVVVSSPSEREGAALEPVLERHPARHVVSAVTAALGDSFMVGRLRIDVLAVEPRLQVRVARLDGRV